MDILYCLLILAIHGLLYNLRGEAQFPFLTGGLLLWIIYFVAKLKYQGKFLTKKTWTSDILIVEVSEELLIYLWVFYFIIQAMKGSGLFTNLLAVVSEWTSWINLSLFPRPVAFLLRLTLIFSVLSFYYHKKIKKKIYEKLDKDKFPEYDFPFQSNLVDFLNSDNQIGQNIYWLDGAWGTGKTYFIRTFFERQKYKVREIYYISCFGIKTRSQAEQVLQSEIESRSRLGIFSNIPVIGSLISWGFSASGLGLMKKNAIIVFDDLERVVYNEDGKDNPANYNDLLGFIDYLANHKNQKVIMICNSKEIKETKEKIIEDKFSYSQNEMNLKKMLNKILDDGFAFNGEDKDTKDKLEKFKEILLALYLLKFSMNSKINFRKLKKDIAHYKTVLLKGTAQDKSNWLIDIVFFIIDDLNLLMRDKYLQFLFKLMKEQWELDFRKNGNIHPYHLLENILIIDSKTDRPEGNDYFGYSDFVSQLKNIISDYLRVLKVCYSCEDFCPMCFMVVDEIVQYTYENSHTDFNDSPLKSKSEMLKVTYEDWEAFKKE